MLIKSSAFASDEIKSVLSPDEVGFHRKVISSTERGFIPDEGRI